MEGGGALRSLSGRQPLASGRALILAPRLPILDEPSEGIHPDIVHEIGDTVRRLDRFRIPHEGRPVAGGAIEALDGEVVRRPLTA